MSSRGEALSCPSAQPDMEDARAFGVVSGSASHPRIAYLKRDAAEALTLPDLEAIELTRIFRFSGRCETQRCAQFQDGRCGLGQRIVAGLGAVVDAAPSCQVRATCRWHSEQGVAACLRCPQIVTLVPEGQIRVQAVAARPE